MESQGSVIRDKEGKVEKVVVVSRNVTERKKAEEELRQSFKKLQKMMGDTVQAIALTVEMKDLYTAGHQRRVAKLAAEIAKEMKLSETQVEGIHISGLLHDIGKIAVPSEILSKPGKITEIEFMIIKSHTQVGFEILKNIEFPWPVAQVALQHHERLNGSGYPFGISGEEMLLESKVMAVADVVEAMCSHRPYRPALGVDKALEEVSKNKGVLYDSEVVEACLKVFKQGFEFE
jgi:putative nucleotidyltransferase with HDIG domain